MRKRARGGWAAEKVHGRSAVALLGAAAVVAVCPATATALPDGMAYELVSPAKKNNDAGAQPGAGAIYSVGAADGNAVLYGTLGPVGEVERGLQQWAVSRRTREGWQTRSALPAPEVRTVTFRHSGIGLAPSADFTRVLFFTGSQFLQEQPPDTSSLQTTESLLLSDVWGGDTSWVTKPTTSDPVPVPNQPRANDHFFSVGASPDLSTTYFWTPGVLTPEDAPRKTLAQSFAAGGIYQYRNGVLSSAALLPSGSPDPEGAVPAGTTEGSPGVGTVPPANDEHRPSLFHNQVSRDGQQLLFVSPDPRAPTSRPSQLYLRRQGEPTRLVSKENGTETTAPSGVVSMTHATTANSGETTFAHATPDGSHVFFQSTDPLTADAPATSDAKTYRYNRASDDLTYLPGVTGTFVNASPDGDRLWFVTPATDAIMQWTSAGVTTVTGLMQLSFMGAVTQSRVSSDGRVLVFQTANDVPGFNTGSQEQVYRYDSGSGTLQCVSCPPSSVFPTGPARMSNDDQWQSAGTFVASRGMTPDGETIFFDTPERLRADDTNTVRDVYRWRGGRVELISGGDGTRDSHLLDSSADGSTVFVATADGLVDEDTNGAYDVYAARAGGGFPKPAAPPSCTDCQGPAAPAPQANGPASETYTGPGNVPAPSGSGASKAKRVTVASRTVRGTSVRLSVKAPGPGRISASGSRARRVTRGVSRAGTYTVTVRLSAAGRKQLRRKGRVALNIRVGFVPESGSSSSTTVRATVNR